MKMKNADEDLLSYTQFSLKQISLMDFSSWAYHCHLICSFNSQNKQLLY